MQKEACLVLYVAMVEEMSIRKHQALEFGSKDNRIF